MPMSNSFLLLNDHDISIIKCSSGIDPGLSSVPGPGFKLEPVMGMSYVPWTHVLVTPKTPPRLMDLSGQQVGISVVNERVILIFGMI